MEIKKMNLSRRDVLRGSLGVAGMAIVAGTLASCAPAGKSGGDGSSKDPIVIGGISDLTGDLAALGIAQQQMGLLAIKRLNDQGGVLGRKIEINYVDGATDPSTWALRAKRLLDLPLVIGGLTGAERSAVKDIITARTMYIAPGYTEDAGQNCQNNMFGTGAVPEQFITPLVDYIVEKSGGGSVYVLGSDYDYPRGANKVALARFAELGVEVVGEDYFPLNATTFASAVNKIATLKPTMVFSNVIPPTGFTLVKQLHEAGLWDKIIFATPGSDEGWIAGGGAQVAGMYACMDYFDTLDDKVSTEIRDAYYKEYGKKYPISSAGSATGVYRGIMLWADAVEKAGTTDPAKVAKTMENASTDYAPGGSAQMAPGTRNAKVATYIGQLTADKVNIVKTVPLVDPPKC